MSHTQSVCIISRKRSRKRACDFALSPRASSSSHAPHAAAAAAAAVTRPRPPARKQKQNKNTQVGDYGFDPLRLGTNKENLKWFREAELTNGRWAMAAVAGILFTDLVGLPKFWEAGALVRFVCVLCRGGGGLCLCLCVCAVIVPTTPPLSHTHSHTQTNQNTRPNPKTKN